MSQSYPIFYLISSYAPMPTMHTEKRFKLNPFYRHHQNQTLLNPPFSTIPIPSFLSRTLTRSKKYLAALDSFSNLKFLGPFYNSGVSTFS